MVDFQSELTNDLILFHEHGIQSFELLIEVLDLLFVGLNLGGETFQFSDSESVLVDILFLGLNLSGQEFDLLGEVDQLFFQSLLVSEGEVKIVFVLGSLDTFVVK